MSLVVLTSVSGAPGVTTTALGLVLCWPGSAMLVDADRSASHAIQAGYLRGESTHGSGLQGLLQAHRERRDLRQALHEESRDLPPLPHSPEQPPPECRFLPGFTHLGSVDLFESAWPHVVDAVRDAPYDVIVDAGRIGHRGLPPGLVHEADAVGLVCRSSLTSLAALRLHVGPLIEAGPPGRVGLVVVGPGRPYGAREAAEQFRVPVLFDVAWDSPAASELAEGPVGKRWVRSSLARSLAKAAGNLTVGSGVGVPS